MSDVNILNLDGIFSQSVLSVFKLLIHCVLILSNIFPQLTHPNELVTQPKLFKQTLNKRQFYYTLVG